MPHLASWAPCLLFSFLSSRPPAGLPACCQARAGADPPDCYRFSVLEFSCAAFAYCKHTAPFPLRAIGLSLQPHQRASARWVLLSNSHTRPWPVEAMLFECSPFSFLLQAPLMPPFPLPLPAHFIPWLHSNCHSAQATALPHALLCCLQTKPTRLCWSRIPLQLHEHCTPRRQNTGAGTSDLQLRVCRRGHGRAAAAGEYQMNHLLLCNVLLLWLD